MDGYWSIERCAWVTGPEAVSSPVPVAAHGLERAEAALREDLPGQRQPAADRAVPADH